MLANNVQKTIDAIYPVGALYLSMNDTNPETLFGGKWKQLTADAYLKIVTSEASETAKGNTDHKISIDQMPSHTHIQNAHTHNLYSNNTWGDASVGFYQSTSSSSGISSVKNGTKAGSKGYYNRTINDATQLVQNTTATNQNTGGGQAYYPGYIGIYVWYRTA